MTPKASVDLHGYNAWRRALVPHPPKTIILFLKERRGVTMGSTIKEGSYFMLGTVVEGIQRAKYPCDLVYPMVQCSKSGKLFKRTEFYTVEGIASMLDEGMIRIVR